MDQIKFGLEGYFLNFNMEKMVRIPHCAIKYSRLSYVTNGDAARRSKTHCDENGLGVFFFFAKYKIGYVNQT